MVNLARLPLGDIQIIRDMGAITNDASINMHIRKLLLVCVSLSSKQILGGGMAGPKDTYIFILMCMVNPVTTLGDTCSPSHQPHS